MARGILEKIDEMADQADLNDVLFAEPEPRQPDAVEIEQRNANVAEQMLEPSQVSAVDDPDVVQVAGISDIVTGTSKWIGERVKKAEQATHIKLPDAHSIT